MAMIVMLSVPRTAKCTAGPTAVEGERCGKPAVTGFVVGSRHYYECELHATPGFPTRHPGKESAPEDPSPGAPEGLSTLLDQPQPIQPTPEGGAEQEE